MSYNYKNQYRCAFIVRGRGQDERDDLVPAFAKAIAEVCPTKKEDFAKKLDDRLKYILPTGVNLKTIRNYRTEATGALLGMVYVEDGICYEGARSRKLLSDGDNPAFFKDICWKLQVPSPISKKQSVQEFIGKEIRLRIGVFVVRVIAECERIGIKSVSKKELGYYALSCLPVLQGKIPPNAVAQLIKDQRAKNSDEDTSMTGSKKTQHINELINLLKYSNLLVFLDNGRSVRINWAEKNAVGKFLTEDYTNLLFPIDSDSLTDWRATYAKWSSFYAAVEPDLSEIFSTPDVMMDKTDENLPPAPLLGKEEETIGDAGERWVVENEKRRVGLNEPRWSRLVQHIGKIRGMGYDVKSVLADEKPSDPTEQMFIEVKSTKRVTPPSGKFRDMVSLTPNEMDAARQFKEKYWIYRVYFCQEGVHLFRIPSPFTRASDTTSGIRLEASGWSMFFTGKSGQIYKYSNS